MSCVVSGNVGQELSRSQGQARLATLQQNSMAAHPEQQGNNVASSMYIPISITYPTLALYPYPGKRMGKGTLYPRIF